LLDVIIGDHLIQIQGADTIERNIIVDLILEAQGQGQDRIRDKFSFCFLGFYIIFFEFLIIFIFGIKFE
jgi:hypothetical protein